MNKIKSTKMKFLILTIVIILIAWLMPAGLVYGQEPELQYDITVAKLISSQPPEAYTPTEFTYTLIETGETLTVTPLEPVEAGPENPWYSAGVFTGLEPGIYHFRPHYFDLELLKKGDFSEECAKVALNQSMVKSAQVTFVWTAVVERSKWKYLQRAYRYIYLDAGHIGQNLYLAAEALRLGCCTIGAIFDEEANKLIDVDGINETVVYMATVGMLKLSI